MKSVPIILKTVACIKVVREACYCGHLNVKGINFYQGHLMFERMVNELDALIDPLAERATALGGTVDTQAQAVIDLSKDVVTPVNAQRTFELKDYVNALIDIYVTLNKHVADSISELQTMGDWVTSNHYQEVLFQLDHHLYFLESTVW